MRLIYAVRWLGLAVAALWTSAAAAQNSEPITVATIERPPFMMKAEDGTLSGFSIDLMREIGERLGRPVSFKEESVFGDMLADAESGAVDLAIANISMTSARETVMDFSLPIYDSGFRILLAEGAGDASLLSLFWQSGVPQLILGAILILILVAHLMWFLEGRKEGAHPYFRSGYREGVWDAFWWSFILVTMGGFENERPKRPWAAAFAVIWVLVGLFFISSFTAMITTAMTVEQLESSVRDHRDLKGKKVGIAVGTTMETFAKANGVAYRPYADFNQAVEAVMTGEIDATIGDAPVVDYLALHKGQGKVTAAGVVFAPERIGAAFPSRSPLREPFNRALLRIIEDGTYADLETRYFAKD